MMGCASDALVLKFMSTIILQGQDRWLIKMEIELLIIHPSFKMARDTTRIMKMKRVAENPLISS